MSGDIRVRVTGPETSGGRFNNNESIDANSVSSGNMTTGVNVGGKQVFMTKEGAAAYNSRMENGKMLEEMTGRATKGEVQSDPGFLSRFFLGDDEKYKGNP